MPWADGVSFAGLLHGGSGGRTWMLEDHPKGGFTGGRMGDSGPWWGIRTPDWHYVEWRGPHLYNLRNDPLEMHDISRDNAGRVAQFARQALSVMRAQHARWQIPVSPQTLRLMANK
jgi:arylsulfatase A-like enzyme